MDKLLDFGNTLPSEACERLVPLRRREPTLWGPPLCRLVGNSVTVAVTRCKGNTFARGEGGLNGQRAVSR